ncbi:hypothetical protein B0I00_0759 [Novosphingobium kunmingense]|uniref:Uncharacterized protein n=1 Tax=Novosphingobium kunmingense TaxID=1211806 RepID=A0A2N0I2Z4_9SPHN|nr:hypothetical protein B0I00_0759 [Novosphingobium kunmingense]
MAVWIALGAAFMGVLTVFIAVHAAKQKNKDSGNAG